MRRRQFIAALGGATAWPLAGFAQQDDRARMVGWLDGQEENAASRTLRSTLQGLGWIDGKNLKIERRVTAGDAKRIPGLASELVSLKPDVIIAGGAAPARAVQQATGTIPIVVTRGGDAAVLGLVSDIARPKGNVTGFSSSEPTIAGKWLELLKDAVPSIARVGVIYKPDVGPTSERYVASIEAAGRKLSLQVVQLSFHDTVGLVRLIDRFATEPNGALLVLPPFTPDSAVTIKLAVQHRLPAIYPGRVFAAQGGLISYNSDDVDLHRRAASYVDHLLRGSKVADLPLQFPTKYVLVVNMRTARETGLNISPSFLLNADEVIE